MDWDWKRITPEAEERGDIGEVLRACFHEAGHARIAFEADHIAVRGMILAQHERGGGHTEIDMRDLRKKRYTGHVAVAGVLAEAKASAGGGAGRLPLDDEQGALLAALDRWQNTGRFTEDQPPDQGGAWLRIPVNGEVDKTIATITDDDALRIADGEWDLAHLRTSIKETCYLLNQEQIWATVQALAMKLAVKGGLSGAAVLRIITTGR